MAPDRRRAVLIIALVLAAVAFLIVLGQLGIASALETTEAGLPRMTNQGEALLEGNRHDARL